MARRGTKRRSGPSKGEPRRVLRVFVGVVSVALAGAFLVYFNRYLRESEHFQVRSVEIAGASFLDTNVVLAKSGITGGDNIFFFDSELARSEVEDLPYVRSCEISVRFPDTVVLAIEERRPHATLLVHSRAYELDSDGVVLREYPAGEFPRSPLITNIRDLNFIEPGQLLEHASLSAAMEVWDACVRHGLTEIFTVAEISAPHEDRISMFVEEGAYAIRWGRNDFDRQARRLRAYWEAMAGPGPCEEYLDLRFGRDLACK